MTFLQITADNLMKLKKIINVGKKYLKATTYLKLKMIMK